MKKQRSASYPYWTITYCLEFCLLIYKNFGKYRATREQIAKALEVSVGTLSQKIGSSVQYGLLDLKPKEGYIITSLFSKWNRPVNDVQKKEALIEIFKNPPLYEALIRTFENEMLPQTNALSNILFQDHNISESACERAATVFIENANELSFISGEGMLIFNESQSTQKEIGQIEEISEDILNTHKESIFPKENQSSNIRNNQISIKPSIDEESTYTINEESNERKNYVNQKSIPYNIPLKGKFPAQLLVPRDIQSRDFEFIIDFINLMKRQFD